MSAPVGPRIDADHPVVIVGAGLAGLCCAIELDRVGVPWQLVDAADAPGGRVRTDEVEGFRLDRGFQVLLTAYPEARRLLDYAALDLQTFLPGADVWLDGARHRVGDPRRRPGDLPATVRAPVGSVLDKARVALLQAQLSRRGSHELMDGPETTTAARLRDAGFSPTMIDRLFRPLFAGIQLDPTLGTSSRAFDFVFAMLARGDNAVPAAGMEEIPRQLAARLAPERLRTSTRVTRVSAEAVTLDDAGELPAGAVVLATDAGGAHALDPAVEDPGANGVGALWYAAEVAPVTDPVIILDGAGTGPVNNLAVMSQVAPGYAPPGAHLVCASVLEGYAADDAAPDADVRAQLRSWFGATVGGWRLLRVDRIPAAQPRQGPPRLSPPQRTVRLGPGRYVCGDHRDDASINGAMASGRRAAEAVTADAR